MLIKCVTGFSVLVTFKHEGVGAYHIAPQIRRADLNALLNFFVVVFVNASGSISYTFGLYAFRDLPQLADFVVHLVHHAVQIHVIDALGPVWSVSFRHFALLWHN